MAVQKNKTDFYAVLEIGRSASIADVKSAYRNLARTWHPDANPNDIPAAEEKFKIIAEAYRILSDPRSRKEYDVFNPRHGRNPIRKSPPPEAKADRPTAPPPRPSQQSQGTNLPATVAARTPSDDEELERAFETYDAFFSRDDEQSAGFSSFFDTWFAAKKP